MHRVLVILSAGLILLCSACTVGPNYKRPSAPAPPQFKEAPPDGWKQSQPSDGVLKVNWWELYGDPALNALEEQVSISNQNVLQAEAQYREAKAQVRVARSALFPTVGTSPAITESRAGGGAANAGQPSRAITSFNLPFDVSWEPDLWGSLRRGVTANAATAQSAAADLENAKLLYRAELAQDYFQLHGLDGEADLLKRTADSYQEYLTLTRNRFAGGIASDLDVAQAESQLYGTQASLINLGEQRAQFEHAIAILIGKAPAEVTIPPSTLTTPPPPVPIGVPSELLERRPDVASAERHVAAANEQIGIAMAAYYPTLTLSGSGGFQSNTLAKWLTLPSRFWSVGPQLSETLFDAGRRGAIVAGQRAAYDVTVATYRQTVLTALQQVEDNLASLHVLADEDTKVQDTIQSATRALNVSTAQYRAGTASYLTVITSQATLLSAEQTGVTLLTRRLVSSVLLIEALGGGWNASQLPSRQDVAKKE